MSPVAQLARAGPERLLRRVKSYDRGTARACSQLVCTSGAGSDLDQRHKRWAVAMIGALRSGSTRWWLCVAAHRLGCWLCLCIQQADVFRPDRSTWLWINDQGSFDPLRCLSSPRLCGAQRGTVERGTSGDVPVRALRRPPLALRPPSGWLARGRGRPRSDGAIPCLARRVDARRGRACI